MEFQQGISVLTTAFGMMEGYGIYTFLKELQTRSPEVRRLIPARYFKHVFSAKHFAVLWSSISFYYGFTQYNMSLQGRDFNLKNNKEIDSCLPEFSQTGAQLAYLWRSAPQIYIPVDYYRKNVRSSIDLS